MDILPKILMGLLGFIYLNHSLHAHGDVDQFGRQAVADSLSLRIEKDLPAEERLQLFYDLTAEYNNVNPQESIRFADSVIRWAAALGNEKRLYQGQYAKGAGYYFLGEIDSALKYVQISRAQAVFMGIEVDMADCYNLLGAVYKGKGDYLLALDAFQEGLTISKEIQDTTQIYTLMINMAEILHLQGDDAQAFAVYQDGLDLIMATTGEESFAAAVVQNNMGELLHVSPDSSLEYLNKAQGIFQAFGYADGLAHTFSNQAEVFLAMGRYASARKSVQEACVIWEEAATNFKPGLVIAYSRWGLASAGLRNGEEARLYSDKAIDLGLSSELRPELKEAYFDRANIEEQLGNSADALLFLKKGTQLANELLDETRSRELSQSRIRFEAEEKDKELAQRELELTQQQIRTSQIFWGSAILLLVVVIAFLYARNRQQLRRREAEHALELQEEEARNLKVLQKMQSTFFANISHEFRTPLTLILGPLKRLMKGNIPQKEAQMQYRLMDRNAGRLLHLINQLLDLSKLEAGKTIIRPQKGDLAAFLRTLVGQFESWAASKDIQFHIDLPQAPVGAAFDPDQLNQIISNLLSNAFKYTPEGGEVRVKGVVAGTGLELSVEDNGIGIEEAELPRIFDRFYQTPNEHYRGTGIGLALVKELVAQHGGTIAVKSSPGKGSRFDLFIPLSHTTLVEFPGTLKKLKPAVPGPWKEQREEKQIPIPSTGPKPRLLVAEDNADVRLYLQSLLSDQYLIETAENGRIAFEKAQTILPDLIISDIMMPEMDGYALTRALKEDLRTSHIPVVQLTAKAGQESMLEGLETRADDYLIKPFDESELRMRIRNRIEQRQRLSQQLGKDIVRLSPDEVVVKSADKVFLEKVLDVAENYLHDETFSVEDLGREVGLSRSQLHRKLKALTDQSPSVFLRTLRLKRAHQLLTQQVATAAEIAYEVGFSSPAYFSKCYKDQYGFTPRQTATG